MVQRCWVRSENLGPDRVRSQPKARRPMHRPVTGEARRLPRPPKAFGRQQANKDHLASSCRGFRSRPHGIAVCRPRQNGPLRRRAATILRTEPCGPKGRRVVGHVAILSIHALRVRNQAPAGRSSQNSPAASRQTVRFRATAMPSAEKRARKGDEAARPWRPDVGY